MDHNSSETAGMPQIILYLLVDFLIVDMKPLPLEAISMMPRDKDPRADSLVHKTFWAMTLVHRSWTNAARRGLWRRAVVRSYDLATAHWDTERCVQLRELAVTLHDWNTGDEDFEGEEERLVNILRLSPNLQVLFIEYAQECGSNFDIVVEQLLLQTNLKRLWLVTFPIACMNKICTVVANLPNLKSLVLDCGQEMIDGNPPSANLLEQLGPPGRSLQSVAITKPLYWAYITWLLQLQGEKGILHFAISLRDPSYFEEDPEFIARFYDYLPTLHSLHVLTSDADDISAKHLQGETLDSFLFMATNLRQLTLSVGSELRVQHLRLPGSLKRLHIHTELYATYLGQIRHRQKLEINDDSISSVLKEEMCFWTIYLCFQPCLRRPK